MTKNDTYIVDEHKTIKQKKKCPKRTGTTQNASLNQ